VAQQPVARFQRKRGGIQRRAVGEGLGGTHGVNTRNEAAHPFQHLEVVQLGAAAPFVGADRKTETCVLVQRLVHAGRGVDVACRRAQRQWGHHRHLGLHQLGGKRVLFFNLRPCPAFGAVKLQHHGVVALAGLVQVRQIHAVFVRVECGQAAIAPQVHTGQCVQHHIGCQALEGVLVNSGIGSRVRGVSVQSFPVLCGHVSIVRFGVLGPCGCLGMHGEAGSPDRPTNVWAQCNAGTMAVHARLWAAKIVA
jgi:hypothetical protein